MLRPGSMLGILGAGALVAALATSPAAAFSRHPAAPTPVSGGTAVVALPAQVNIPWYIPLENSANYSGYVIELTSLLYQPLLWQNAQHQIDYTQSIASKVTYNSAGTVYNVFMNPKWHWSNGRPITSADAQFSWNVMIAAEQSTTAPWPAGIQGSGGLPGNAQGFQVDGPYEFTITLKKPANQVWFEYNGLGNMPIMPAVWNRYPANMAQELAYLGKEAVNPAFDTPVSGPFMLSSAVQDQAWTLARNPNYSGHKAYLSRLIFRFEASDASLFADLRSGTAQFGPLPSADWAARAELKDTILKAYGFGFGFIWVNMNAGAQGGVSTIFRNLYVRQAMQEGVDVNGIGQIIYHNQYQPVFGPLDTTPKSVFLAPALNKPVYPFNPAAGKALLEAHGWKEVNGVMTKGNQTMDFTMQYSSGDLAITQEMELLQADWAQEGIKINLQPTPFASVLKAMSARTPWEMVGGLTWGYPGYPSGEQMFYKAQGVDWYGWNDPTENALVQKTISPAPNAAANLQNLFAFETYTARMAPQIFLPLPVTDNEVAYNLHGVTTATADSWSDLEPQYWWVSGS